MHLSIETRRRRADAANLRLLPCPDYISSGLSFSLARAVVPKIPALLLAVALSRASIILIEGHSNLVRTNFAGGYAGG
jgi:hypothetical protein